VTTELRHQHQRARDRRARDHGEEIDAKDRTLHGIRAPALPLPDAADDDAGEQQRLRTIDHQRHRVRPLALRKHHGTEGEGVDSDNAATIDQPRRVDPEQHRHGRRHHHAREVVDA
jgi:hypothetical protein